MFARSAPPMVLDAIAPLIPSGVIDEYKETGGASCPIEDASSTTFDTSLTISDPFSIAIVAVFVTSLTAILAFSNAPLAPLIASATGCAAISIGFRK